MKTATAESLVTVPMKFLAKYWHYLNFENQEMCWDVMTIEEKENLVLQLEKDQEERAVKRTEKDREKEEQEFIYQLSKQ